jgi:hypothetical protein
MEYFYYFKIFLFISGISSQIFLGDLFSKWSLACILCFAATMFLPFEKYMVNYLEIKEEDIVLESFKQVYYNFEDDYLRSNPLTKQKGMEKFLEAKRDAGDITEEEFNKLRNDIQTNGNNEEMFKLNYSSKKGVKNNLEKYKKNLMNANPLINAAMTQIRPNAPTYNQYKNNINNNNNADYEVQFTPENNNNLVLNPEGYNNNQGEFNNQGYNNGYNNGYNQGYNNNVGYNNGYNQGYNNGMNN